LTTIHVKELERDVGGAMVIVGHDVGPEGRSIQVPVSHDRSKALRDALLTNATGLRRGRSITFMNSRSFDQ